MLIPLNVLTLRRYAAELRKMPKMCQKNLFFFRRLLHVLSFGHAFLGKMRGLLIW